jgi:CBS domain-containing protein
MSTERTERSAPLKSFVAGPAHTVAPDTTVRDIAQILSSYEIGLVLVEDGDTIVGVVSERDLVRGLAIHDEFAVVGSFVEMKATDVMTGNPVIAGAGTTVDDAIDVMREEGVRHLLVPMAEGYGVVSIRDLA